MYSGILPQELAEILMLLRDFAAPLQEPERNPVCTRGLYNRISHKCRVCYGISLQEPERNLINWVDSITGTRRNTDFTMGGRCTSPRELFHVLGGSYSRNSQKY